MSAAPPSPRYGYQADEQFQKVLDELSNLQQQVVSARNWYKSHARWPMVLFRASGSLIILLSISTPFIAAQDQPWKDMAVSIATLAIAALTGLNAFFRWEHAWQGYRQTQYALDHLLTVWALRIVEAHHMTEAQSAIPLAFQATERLLEEARVVTSQETGDYFRLVQTPQIQGATK